MAASSGDRTGVERDFTPDSRAKFLFADPRPLPEEPNPRYPLLLLTGRGTSSQWHTGTRTKRSAVLQRLSPSELYVEISPTDARKLGIEAEDAVAVSSQRATVRAKAFVTNSVAPGQVFMPMHYETMNRLTFAAFDPHSRQPAYKACAVKVERVERGEG
jgi:assimilatory nitrate reductase catalytic subunit